MFTACSPSSARTRSWERGNRSRSACSSPAGVFSTGDPGSMLDVLARARASLGGGQQLVHYLAVPPVAFAGLTKALGEHGLAEGARVVYEKPPSRLFQPGFPQVNRPAWLHPDSPRPMP
jgi:Glucose-6-phosphate dehydrogenase, NAD binding domain